MESGVLAIVKAMRSSAVGASNQKVRELLERHHATVLAEGEEAVLSIPSARSAVDLALEWRRLDPDVSLAIGSVADTAPSARAARLRSVVNCFTVPMIAVVGSVNGLLEASTADLTVTNLGTHSFEDLLEP